MIDFLLGLALGAVVASYAVIHFRGQTPAKIVSDLSNLEQRIRTVMSQAFNDAFAAYQAAVESDKQKAVDAAVAAKAAEMQQQIDAAKEAGAQAESDEDTATVAAATAALTG